MGELDTAALEGYHESCKRFRRMYDEFMDAYGQTNPLRIWKRQRLLANANLVLLSLTLELEGLTSILQRGIEGE